MREKKIKLTAVEKKIEIIKSKKLGNLTGALGIRESNNRYILIIRYMPRGKKKEKIKPLFSCPDLKFIQDIGDKLSIEKKFPYNPTPVSIKAKRQKTKEEKNAYQIDTTIFKEFNGHYFVMTDFGSIFLDGNNKYHVRRNYEKIDGIKIFELNAKTASSKFVELFKTYDDIHKERILKDVIRLGNSEDRNSVRVMMGYEPLIASVSLDGSKVINRKMSEVVDSNNDEN